ncbi:MAG: hypothetical protein V4662_13220 [Verrucomicrobiota bacterium]
MKLALQVLMHGVAAFAGYWLVSGEAAQEPTKLEETATHARTLAVAGTQAAKASSRLPGMDLNPLSPETWPNEIALIQKMQKFELSAALRRYLSCRFPDVRLRLMRYLFERWALLDRAGALAALEGIPSPQMKDRALRAILSEWVKVDEAAAWQHVTSMSQDTVLQEAGIQSLLGLCADKDPTNYVSWTKQLDDPFLRGKALDSIAHVWAQKDPKGALEAAFAEENSYLRGRLFELVSHKDKSGIDFAQALDRILQIPGQAERVRVMNDWVAIFANKQPGDALRWLQQHANLPELQAASGIIGKLMTGQTKLVSDIRTAALSLPEGPVRDAFAANAAGAWASRGHPTPEAEQILALVGPCIEREYAIISIERHRKPR